MGIALFGFLGLGLLLGLKHAFDPDHLIVVSHFLSKMTSFKSAIKAGFSWALGHMLTASVITVILFTFKATLFSAVLVHFEKIVGGVLIILGIVSLKSFFEFHAHAHPHGPLVHSHPHVHAKNENEDHVHKHIFGIGILHGLASNNELLILLTASIGITSLGGVLLGLASFSLGVVLGMVGFSCLFLAPILKINHDKLRRSVALLSGTVSVVVGGMMLA